MTFLDKKPFIYVWRPFYRAFFQGVMWPFLARIKTFVLAEITADVTAVKQTLGQTSDSTLIERLSALEAENRALRQQAEAILTRLAAMETENSNQWQNISKLLLCLYQQPRANSEIADSRRADAPLSLSRTAS
jgi:septal ring factor EnvC (AmiA/AmiB activator)